MTMKGRFKPLASSLMAMAVAMMTAPVAMSQTSAKITELPAASSLSTTDLVLTVTDPSGTPVTKSATLAVLFDLLDNATLTLTNKTISGSSNTITGVPQSGVSNLVACMPLAPVRVVAAEALLLRVRQARAAQAFAVAAAAAELLE